MERWRWPDLGFRPVFFPALAFVLGAAVGPETGLGGDLFLAVTGALWAATGLRGRRVGSHILLLCAFFASGGALALLSMQTLVPGGIADGTVVLEGALERVERRESYTQLELRVVRAGEPLGEARFRARLSTHEPLRGLEIGQWVRLRARLKAVSGPDNPGEWDGARLRERKGLSFTGGILEGSVLPLSAPPAWRTWVRARHEEMTARVESLAPSPAGASLYLTLAAGLRARLDDDLEEAFGDSGLAHILSVSGLHVAALALLLLRLLRALLVRFSRAAVAIDARRLAAPLAVPLLWSYVAFTGMQVPAVRSAVMATVVFIGLALWRRADSLNALSVAAAVIVAVAPASVMDLSLQLSFVAVLSLILVSPALRQLVPIARPAAEASWLLRAREACLEASCAGIAVTLASAPLLAGSFGRLSVIGVVANVVCLPLSAVLTVLAAGGAALFVISPLLSTPILWLGALFSELLVLVARLFAAVPSAAMPVRPLGTALALLSLFGLLFFALAQRRWRWAGLALPLGLLVTAASLSKREAPGLVVTFLAVGQGDAIVLSSGGSHALVDGGGVPKGADTGRRYVLPFLRREGITSLELAVLSHPHPDHALGLISALEKIPTERLWVAAGTSEGTLTRQVRAAARSPRGSPSLFRETDTTAPTLRLGEARIEVLGPPEDRLLLEDVNDRSIVLRVSHGAVSFLLTGDIEEAAEERLLGALTPVTVLKAPHHGSRSSSTDDFVRRTRPRHVVFCVGRNNRFGFPHEEVVERYRAAGARCHRTDVSGALRVESDGRDVRLVPFHTPEALERPRAIARRASRRHLQAR